VNLSLISFINPNPLGIFIMKLSTLFGAVPNLNTSKLITVSDQSLIALLNTHAINVLAGVTSGNMVHSKEPLGHVPHFLNLKQNVRLTNHQDGRLKRGIPASAVYVPMKIADAHGAIYHEYNNTMYIHILLTDYTTLSMKSIHSVEGNLTFDISDRIGEVKDIIRQHLKRSGLKKLEVKTPSLPVGVISTKVVKSATKRKPMLVPDVPGSVEAQLRHELTMQVKDLERKVDKMEKQLNANSTAMNKSASAMAVLVKQLEQLL
jgi:hypothetical protein